MSDPDDYSGGPSLRGVRRSYKKAARRGTAIPVDERGGSVLDNDVYSTKREFKKQAAAMGGMKEGAKSNEYKTSARDIEKRDRGIIKDLDRRGAGRLTVKGEKRNMKRLDRKR